MYRQRKVDGSRDAAHWCGDTAYMIRICQPHESVYSFFPSALFIPRGHTSDTPAMAPAANWYWKGSGFWVVLDDMMIDEKTNPVN